MPYVKTEWADSVTPINEDNLNHGETQYEQAMADGAVRFAPMSMQQLAVMTDIWAGDKVAAAGISAANYADAVSTTEVWGSLSNWAYTAGAVQVSGGKLYGTSTASGSSGLNRSFPLGPTDKLVMKTTVTIPSGSTTQDTIIGVSDDAAGSVPTSAARGAIGIDFQGSDMTIRSWNKTRDTSTTPLGTFVAGGTYFVSVVADQNTIVFSVTQANSTFNVGWTFQRNGFAINNLYIFNNDTRALTGNAVGALGAAKGLVSFRSRSGLEDLAPFWTHISDNGTYRVAVSLPKNFDSRKPTPMVLAFHGKGSSASGYHFGDNNGTDMMSAFTAAGFMVVSASLNSNFATWGSDAGLAAYEYAYRYAKSFFPISSVVFFGNSMGGIESLLTLARNNIPCSAWMATVPTVSLRNNYTANYGADITTAYGLAADGSDYVAKTAGHDPLLMPFSAFRGVPMMVTVATDDLSVFPDQNWNLIEPLAVQGARAYKRVNVTGGHVSRDIGTQSAQFVAFAQQFVTPPVG